MNIYQIAEKAGVSIATVSRVLNNSDAVSEKTRERVLRIMESDHYQPNAFARGLVTDSMKLIGVICTDVSDLFIARALSLLQAQLRQRKYDTLLFCVGSHQETTTKHMHYLQSKHVDAIFLIGSAFSDSVDREKLREMARSTPVIMINGFVEAEGIYCVYSDDTAAVAEAVGHLFRRGSTAPVLLYDSMTQGTRRKIDGFRRGLEENGLLFSENALVAAGDSLESSREAVEALFAQGRHPDAVIATSDLLAAGAVKAMESQGVHPWVIGFDNTVLCQCMAPTLTSMDPHIDGMCLRATEILDALLENRQPQQVQLCPTELVWRESFPAPIDPL